MGFAGFDGIDGLSGARGEYGEPGLYQKTFTNIREDYLNFLQAFKGYVVEKENVV